MTSTYEQQCKLTLDEIKNEKIGIVKDFPIVSGRIAEQCLSHVAPGPVKLQIN